MLLGAQGKEEKSCCFSILLSCSLIATILPVFQTIWEELLSWEQERTGEERRMKQWVISSLGSIMPELYVLLFSEGMVTLQFLSQSYVS